jgi:predicted DNA-binding ribbon-helix-helix protein
MSLEDGFWNALAEIAPVHGQTRTRLIEEIDERRDGDNLSSAVRLFVLEYFKQQAADRAAPRIWP